MRNLYILLCDWTRTILQLEEKSSQTSQGQGQHSDHKLLSFVAWTMLVGWHNLYEKTCEWNVFKSQGWHCVGHQTNVLWPFQKHKARPENWLPITCSKNFLKTEGRDEPASFT